MGKQVWGVTAAGVGSVRASISLNANGGGGSQHERGLGGLRGGSGVEALQGGAEPRAQGFKAVLEGEGLVNLLNDKGDIEVAVR